MNKILKNLIVGATISLFAVSGALAQQVCGYSPEMEAMTDDERQVDDWFGHVASEVDILRIETGCLDYAKNRYVYDDRSETLWIAYILADNAMRANRPNDAQPFLDFMIDVFNREISAITAEGYIEERLLDPKYSWGDETSESLYLQTTFVMPAIGRYIIRRDLKGASARFVDTYILSNKCLQNASEFTCRKGQQGELIEVAPGVWSAQDLEDAAYLAIGNATLRGLGIEPIKVPD